MAGREIVEIPPLGSKPSILTVIRTPYILWFFSLSVNHKPTHHFLKAVRSTLNPMDDSADFLISNAFSLFKVV